MSNTPARIPCTLFPGDGIGPEITDATLRVLDALGAPFDWHEQAAGAGAAEKLGDPLPDAAIEDIRQTRLALKGPLTTPVGSGYRSVNVRLREAFQLYANVRPGRSLLPDGKFPDVDLILVRENLGGFYVGVEHFIPIGDDPHAVAEATGILTRENCRRIAEFTCRFPGPRDVDIGDGDAGAFADIGLGKGAADATCSAGDQRGFAVEPFHAIRRPFASNLWVTSSRGVR